MTVNVNGGSHWVAVDEAKSLATGQVYIMDSLGGAQNTDLTLASRYASFVAIHAYTGGSTPEGGTVTPDPDPGLSVKETITCKRTIKLPERVVNLYSNPTDTTRLTYFDYGPTVYSSRYAVMSDGSIMYEVGANHQGQDVKAWLKYESDMTVTKQHTYGSTKYESAHPHRGYKTCQCGDKFYTGETTARSDCSECNGNVKYAVDGGYITFDKKTGTITDCDSTVTKANIPQQIEGVAVKSIGASAFSECRSLTSVTIPNGVTNIGERAFSGCEGLTSVTISDSVTSIGRGAFSYCSSLTGIWVSKGNRYYSSDASGILFSKDQTTLIQYPGAFKAYTIPNSVTNIGDYAFYSCRSLTSVTIPNSVTNIGERAFSECKGLTSVTIPDSVTNIGGGAFSYCSSLTGIWVSKGNRYYSSDASGILFSKDQATLIQCPGAFKAYTYTIPNSVTNIGDYAFYYCSDLTSVTIPDSVTSIGKEAFNFCYKLTDVYYTGTETAWNKIEISNYNDALKNATIHYNSASHEHSYNAVVTAPTCTEKGYTTHTCACGDSYVDTYVNALSHSWNNGVVTKPATATETGIKTFTCTRCSATKTETIPATGCPSAGFTDVPGEDNWAHAGIDYCVANGLMSGVGNNLFAPSMTTTRAQIVQILYNLEGEPKVSGATPFTDLTQGWYQDAVLWAYQTGVVAGTSSTTFDPDLPVTREQIAVILMGYAEKVLGVTRTWVPADLSSFPDAGSVSGWAKDAMADAVGLGLISGASNGGQTCLEPQGSATREQVATILMAFCENVKK